MNRALSPLPRTNPCYYLVVLLALRCVLMTHAFADSSTSPSVFLIAGQSNASGRGELNGKSETSDSRVTMFGNDYTWKTAYEPVDDTAGQVDFISDDTPYLTPGRGHSFALKAAKDLLVSTPSVQLIPTARGASRITQWLKPENPVDRNTLFGSMNHRAKVAVNSQVDALWWFQGESDAGNNVYATEHRQFIQQVRSEMGAQLPVIYVQLARHNDSTTNRRHQDIAEFQRLMETDSGHGLAILRHHMVVSFDLALNDTVHLNQDALKELGRRVALATREHVFFESIDGTGPRLVKHSPIVRHATDLRKVLVRFDRPINAADNNYDNSFRVETSARYYSIDTVTRDEDGVTVVIQLEDVPPADAVLIVTYGDVHAPSTNAPLLNVIRGASGLPAPRFGPLVAAVTPKSDTSGISGWIIR